MNFEKARHNMIEQQIRTWEVLDQRVLHTVSHTPREAFVPASYRNLAFADTNIPLHGGEVMMTPKLEARLLQALSLRPDDEVLEVGTGSGYLTALLTKLAKHVTSVEILPELQSGARKSLVIHNISNATLELGDGVRGWEDAAPYDAIAVTGSVPSLEGDFQRQLKIGGRLFVIVGDPPTMEACLITRVGESDWSTTSLFETSLPPLQGVKEPDRFVF